LKLFHPAIMGTSNIQPINAPTKAWTSKFRATVRFIARPIENERTPKYPPRRFDFHNKLAVIKDKMPAAKIIRPQTGSFAVHLSRCPVIYPYSKRVVKLHTQTKKSYYTEKSINCELYRRDGDYCRPFRGKLFHRF